MGSRVELFEHEAARHAKVPADAIVGSSALTPAAAQGLGLGSLRHATTLTELTLAGRKLGLALARTERRLTADV
jgi:hypothetical protein